MPRILPVDTRTTDNSTSETLAAVEAKLGLLPNLFTTLARSPSALNGYLQLSDTVTAGRLTGRQRELIAIAIAQENACEYCLSAHAAIGQGLGLDKDAIDRARSGGSTQSDDNAIISFALAVVRTRGDVAHSDIDAIRKVYDDDGIMIEIVTNVALNILTNYVNRVAGTEVDFPVVSLETAA